MALLAHAWLVGGPTVLPTPPEPAAAAPATWRVALRPPRPAPALSTPPAGLTPNPQLDPPTATRAAVPPASTQPPQHSPRPPRGQQQAPAEREPAGTAPAADAVAGPPMPPPPPSPETPLDAATDAAGLGEPLPIYTPRLPEPVELHFDASRGQRRGQAVLRWLPAGDHYELELVITPEGGGPGLRQHSRGAVGPSGLMPERFVDSRAGRSARAANFRREEGLLSFSASTDRLPLPEGLQDRLGWLVQLLGVMAARDEAGLLVVPPADGGATAAPSAEPSADTSAAVSADTSANDRASADARSDARTGQPAWAPIVLGVAGLRGGVSRWVFQLRYDWAGDPPSWHLVREPEGPYDTRVELWLDAHAPFWPQRLQYSEARGDALQLVRRAQSGTP